MFALTVTFSVHRTASIGTLIGRRQHRRKLFPIDTLFQDLLRERDHTSCSSYIRSNMDVTAMSIEDDRLCTGLDTGSSHFFVLFLPNADFFSLQFLSHQCCLYKTRTLPITAGYAE